MELKQYTLIIDGLNECAESGKAVVNLVDELIRNTPEPRPRIIILSTNSAKLAEICTGTIPIRMDEKIVMPDIERFITQKIHEFPILEPLEENIFRKARKSCRVHCLWASTMMEALRASAKNRETREKRLHSLPDSMMEAYETLVNQASPGRKAWELKLRREILLLILNPQQSFTVDELELALQYRSKVLQGARYRIDDIRETNLQVCWPLVTIANERVVFVHTLVGDFLTQSATYTKEPSLSMHITCRVRCDTRNQMSQYALWREKSRSKSHFVLGV